MICDRNLSQISYRVAWNNPLTGQALNILVNMRVGPKAVFETADFTTDHGVLLNNTEDVLSVRNAVRYPDAENSWLTGIGNPFSQTIGTELKQKITPYLEVTGNTVAVNSVDLQARVEGFLQEINYKDGSPAKKGDVLFVIEPAPYQAKLKQAQAQAQSLGTPRPQSCTGSRGIGSAQAR